MLAKKRWQVFCFGADEYPDTLAWEERDRSMAETLAARHEQCCSDKKVVAACGNLHSRLEPVQTEPDPPVSFARRLWQDSSEKVVYSFEIHPHGGAFFNNGRVIALPDHLLERVELRRGHRTGHSCILPLSRATPRHLPQAKGTVRLSGADQPHRTMWIASARIGYPLC